MTSKHGLKRNFSTTGLAVNVVDRNSNTTSLGYIDADGDTIVDELETVTDWFGRVSTIAYTSGKMSGFTDFAGRTTNVGMSSGRITQVTLPDPDGGGPLSAPTTAYAWDSSTNLVTSVTDALSHAESFERTGRRRVGNLAEQLAHLDQSVAWFMAAAVLAPRHGEDLSEGRFKGDHVAIE
jgi:hypothetical protein